MGPEYNQQALKECLAQCVIVFGFRQILTKAGISADEPTLVSIKLGDKLLVSLEIPTISTKIFTAQGVTDLGEEIGEFFNRSQAFNGLLRMFHKSEYTELYTVIIDIGKLDTTKLNINGPLSKQTYAFRGCICGDPPQYCSNCNCPGC